MRKVAREVAFKLVYEYLFQRERKELGESELVAAAMLDEADFAYLQEVYDGAIGRMEESQALIARFASGFSLARIFKIDLAILLVALYEMRYLSDVPDSVAINEAVELAKIYSTEKSGGFVNGVLGAINKEEKEMSQCPQQS